MKSIKSFLIILMIGIFIFPSTQSCQDKVLQKQTYTANVPVYMPFSVLRASVTASEPQSITQTGKIYFKDHYLYVNDYFKGIHIIDNANPASPQEIKFINIPGNVDLAIINDKLYADSYTDLVVIDISDLGNIHEVNRINDVFPYTVPAYDENYPIASLDESQGVVIGWQVQEITEVYEGDPGKYYGGDLLWLNSAEGVSSQSYDRPSVGIAGSMARFSMNTTNLYAISESNIKVFDITNISSPVEGTTISTSQTIETLFQYNSNLFVGSQTGMLVYSLSNPSNPTFISEITHIQSCDPVVVEENYAYITLRAGNLCGGINNELEVIDISDLTNPVEVAAYEMTEPYGLGIDNGTLFVCDGSAGLKIYNAADPLTIDQHMLKQYGDINTFDVIPFSNVLMMTAADGIYQYDYSDVNNITLLSVISVNQQ